MKGRTSTSSSFTYEYDVFISFRGVDTRSGFTSNLHKALCEKGVNAFMDEEDLQPGAEINLALDKAIQESRIALVIFSKNYASSTFCLEELTKIVECSKDKGMYVLPVFYHVHPAEVRHNQKGSFAEALAKHEARNYEKEKVEKWRVAMKKVANISGWHIKDDTDRHEYEFIDKIFQDISKKINSLGNGDKNQIFSNVDDKYIAQHDKSFQLDKKSGKKCYMLAARALSIVWGDAPEYWNWVILPESRFPDVAKLLKVCLLEIRGVINTNALSPNTQYAAYLVFKMIDAYGFDLFPVELSVVIFGGQSSTKNVCLDPYLEWWRLHYSLQGLQRPNVRSDGWFEIEMGEFFNSGLQNDEVRMSVQETKGGHWKCGLFIKGIEVRPKEGN